jgi:hypothetical protein
VFQNEFTSIHALHWQDHSFYTEGARRQEMFVRDKVLMRAGQPIVNMQVNMQVNMYANCAIILLLPELEMVCLTTTGAFATARSNCWASCGKIYGVSGKMSMETASEDRRG